MTARSPAGAVAEKSGVVDIANKQPGDASDRLLALGMAFEAKVGVALDEHLGVDGTVRVVADGATFTERRMFEDEGTGLFAMALRAVFVDARHGQATRWFHDVHAVRVVALDAVHFSFNDRVMLRKVEFGTSFLVALKARFGIFARIDNKFFLTTTAGHGDVFAAGAVAGFTAGLPVHLGIIDAQAGVRAGGKNAGDIGMTIQAGLVADVSCAFDLQWGNDCPVGGAGIKQ